MKINVLNNNNITYPDFICLTEDYGIQNPSIFPDPSMRTLRMDYFLEIVKYYKLIWNGELKEFKKEHQ